MNVATIQSLPNRSPRVLTSTGMWSHLVAEVHTGGRVGNLWYVEQLQKVLDLDGH